ncbi:MAG: hypothetical protein IMZ61_07015, partial [Planctomycetes bacterium]|nr:hypothetical protein [Planctomycetota bacterium]
TCAFMDGPVVLAGLNPQYGEMDLRVKPVSQKEYRPNYTIDGTVLRGDSAQPQTFLAPDDEREWWYWRGDYRTRGQSTNLRLIPLYEVRNEVYTVYFEISY